MNDGRRGAVYWAGGLVVTGVLLLLFNFDLLARFEPLAQYIVAGCFAAAAIGFFGSYLARRSMWWRLISGWTFLAVAAMVLLTTSRSVSPLLIPATLFVGLAFAFANTYLINRRENWWAVIPGGFLLVLSVVIGLNTVTDSLELLFGIFVIGIGIVFNLLILLGPPEVRWWPLIPGMVLLLYGLFLLTATSVAERALLRWWPLLLVVLGIGLGWRALGRHTSGEKLSVNVAPGTAAANRIETGPQTASIESEENMLGEYLGPAPGATVDVLSGADDE